MATKMPIRSTPRFGEAAGAEKKPEQNRPERLFEEFLAFMDFHLTKYSDRWGLVDETGANFGNIESDRFEAAEEVVGRLGIYIEDYYASDLRARLGAPVDERLPALLERATAEMPERERSRMQHELDILDTICNHAGEIDLEKCRYTIEEGDPE